MLNFCSIGEKYNINLIISFVEGMINLTEWLSVLWWKWSVASKDWLSVLWGKWSVVCKDLLSVLWGKWSVVCKDWLSVLWWKWSVVCKDWLSVLCTDLETLVLYYYLDCEPSDLKWSQFWPKSCCNLGILPCSSTDFPMLFQWKF